MTHSGAPSTTISDIADETENTQYTVQCEPRQETEAVTQAQSTRIQRLSQEAAEAYLHAVSVMSFGSNKKKIDAEVVRLKEISKHWDVASEALEYMKQLSLGFWEHFDGEKRAGLERDRTWAREDIIGRIGMSAVEKSRESLRTIIRTQYQSLTQRTPSEEERRELEEAVEAACSSVTTVAIAIHKEMDPRTLSWKVEDPAGRSLLQRLQRQGDAIESGLTAAGLEEIWRIGLDDLIRGDFSRLFSDCSELANKAMRTRNINLALTQIDEENEDSNGLSGQGMSVPFVSSFPDSGCVTSVDGGSEDDLSREDGFMMTVPVNPTAPLPSAT